MKAAKYKYTIVTNLMEKAIKERIMEELDPNVDYTIDGFTMIWDKAYNSCHSEGYRSVIEETEYLFNFIENVKDANHWK